MTFGTELDFHRLRVVDMEHLQRMQHSSRERLPFREPGSVPLLGTCFTPIVVTSFQNLPYLSSTFTLGTFLILLCYNAI